MQKYNKLIRDRIPEIIRSSGRNPQVRTLQEAEYIAKLQEKLSEELTEYQQDHSIAELADLVEVVQALVEARGLTWQEFERIRQEKQAERGAFKQRLLLESIE